jgi:O-antigen/teichoic acid export membrane protein
MFGRGLLYTAIYAAQSMMSIAITPIVTRTLGPSGFGRLAAILTLCQVIQLIAGLGLIAGVQRHFADEPGDRETRGLIAFGAFAALVIAGVLQLTLNRWAPVLGFALPDEALVIGIWWAGVSAMGLTVASLLRAQDRLMAFLWVMAAQVLAGQIIGIALIIAVRRSPDMYMAGLLIGQLMGIAFGLVLVRPRIGGIWNVPTTVRTLAFSLPLVPHMLAFLVLNLGDRLIVLRDLGPSAVGRYQLAYNAAAVVLLLLSMLNQAWEPRIYATKDGGLRRSVLAQSRDQLFYLEIPILLGVVLGAPIGLRLLAPPSFQLDGLVVVVALVAISAIPYAAYLANLRTLMAYRRTGSLMWASPVCAGANVLLNIWLVPILGIDGSALATLVCYGMLAATTRLVANRCVRLPRTPAHVWVALALAVAGSCALIPVPANSAAELGVRLFGGLACGIWATLFIVRLVRAPNRSLRPAQRNRWRRVLDPVLFGPVEMPADELPSEGATSTSSASDALGDVRNVRLDNPSQSLDPDEVRVVPR